MHLIINDPEAVEHRLVELPPHVRRGAEVQPVRVGAEQECFFDHFEHGVYLGGAALDDLLRASQFAGDAFLFGLEQVERDGFGVAHLDQLELLVLQVLLAFLLSFKFGAVAGLASLQFGHDRFTDGRDAGSGELNACPVGD